MSDSSTQRYDEAADATTYAPLPPRDEQHNAAAGEQDKIWLDRLMAIQRPIVVRQIRILRGKYPDATPSELIKKIEQQYLNATTVSGGAAGAAAMVPGVGTAASLAVTGVETAGFLEMTSLFGQAVAEIHGLPISDPVRARTLIQSLMLGKASKNLIQQFAGQAFGKGPTKQVFWGEMVTKSLPRALVGELSGRIQSMFLKRFVVRQSASTVGRLVPFGIGAVIGGAGNRMLSHEVVRTSRAAFGVAPASFPIELHPQFAAQKSDGEDEHKALTRGPFSFFRVPLALTRGKDKKTGEGA